MVHAPLRLTVAGGVARITLVEPARGNPIDQAFCDAFDEVATECASRADVRAILIDAEGKYFSVGGDLKLLTSDRAALPALVAQMVTSLNNGIVKLAVADAPVVVSVHGLAAGGGVGLTAAADFVFAAPHVQFYAAFAAIGFSADCGCTNATLGKQPVIFNGR